MTKDIKRDQWRLIKYAYGCRGGGLHLEWNWFYDIMRNQPSIFMDGGKNTMEFTLDELDDVTKLKTKDAFALFTAISTGDCHVGYRGYMFRFLLPPCVDKPFMPGMRECFEINARMLGRMLDEFKCRKIIKVYLNGIANPAPLEVKLKSGTAFAMLENGRKIRILDFPVRPNPTWSNIGLDMSAQLGAIRDFQIAFIVGCDSKDHNAVERVTKNKLYEPRLLDVIMKFVLTHTFSSITDIQGD